MPSFIIIKHQSGGCDYTIGCGINYEWVTAPGVQEAIENVITIIADQGAFDDYEYGLDSVSIYQVGEQIPFNFQKEKARHRQRIADENAAQEETKAREQLAALKARFEG